MNFSGIYRVENVNFKKDILKVAVASQGAMYKGNNTIVNGLKKAKRAMFGDLFSIQC